MNLIKEKDKRQINNFLLLNCIQISNETDNVKQHHFPQEVKRVEFSLFFSIRRSFFARASEFLAQVDHTRDHSFSTAFTSHDEV